jgi:hypothetical protein
MTRTLFALSAAALILATTASAASIPPPPAPVGFCKTDQGLLGTCTTMWNTCQAEAKDKAICRGNWGNCCHHRAIAHWHK